MGTGGDGRPSRVGEVPARTGPAHRPDSDRGGEIMPALKRDTRHRVNFTLNGKPAAGWTEPRMLLSDFLRHEVGATGTHVGCEHGVCGACTVKVDGVATRSCLMLAVQADGRNVETVEGLSRDGGFQSCRRLSAGTTRSSAVSARPAS